MIFSLGLSTHYHHVAPFKAYILWLLAKGENSRLDINQVMVPLPASRILILVGGTLMAALIGGLHLPKIG